MPVQVDGEPWIQPPGDIVVLKSALKVRTELRSRPVQLAYKQDIDFGHTNDHCKQLLSYEALPSILKSSLITWGIRMLWLHS